VAKGEASGIGWFLAHTLELFAMFPGAVGDAVSAERWLTHRTKLGKAIE